MINYGNLKFDNTATAELLINIGLEDKKFEGSVLCEYITPAEYKTLTYKTDGQWMLDYEKVKRMLSKKIHDWSITLEDLQVFIRVGIEGAEPTDKLSFKDKTLYEFTMETIPGLGFAIVKKACDLSFYPEVKIEGN